MNCHCGQNLKMQCFFLANSQLEIEHLCQISVSLTTYRDSKCIALRKRRHLFYSGRGKNESPYARKHCTSAIKWEKITPIFSWKYFFSFGYLKISHFQDCSVMQKCASSICECRRHLWDVNNFFFFCSDLHIFYRENVFIYRRYCHGTQWRPDHLASQHLLSQQRQQDQQGQRPRN